MNASALCLAFLLAVSMLHESVCKREKRGTRIYFISDF